MNLNDAVTYNDLIILIIGFFAARITYGVLKK